MNSRKWISFTDVCTCIGADMFFAMQMANYFSSGGMKPDEFAIGLNNPFHAISGHDIGHFPGLESEKQAEPQACTAL